MGGGNDQLAYAYGITRDSISNILYVSDKSNNRVMGYLRGNNSGFLVAGGTGVGLNRTQLNNPMAIHFDSLSKSLLIVNTLSHNIVRWVLGDNHWTLVAGSDNGTSGITSTLFDSPTDLTLDPMGNLYVVDRLNHRIQFFLSGQSNGTTIAGISGQSGNDSDTLNFPIAIALDNQLNLYVADNLNHRIQKFLRY
jgi:hypothetical protein